uniref:Constitutive coactivator of peroxisome proliferator-activated receptor gamma n=1 Tax=Capra hircus TaxID=9925 RepID=A0A8C2NLA9_CAPHI
MGVRGLHGFVASSCPHVCTVVNFKELAERHRSQHPGGTPAVVVDAMCCLRYWYTPESWVCGGQWREYYSSLREFVSAFTAVGIKLIFFFDGMVEQSKRGEWVKRRLKNNREIAKIFHHIKSHREQPGRNMFFIPSGLAVFTRFALKALGQETLCSLQEADYEVASYGFQNNCLGILGEDTDYLIYDTCPYFSISELSLDSLDTVMLCREKLSQSLGLRLADLPLLACLLGNDVVPEGMFESFRYKCLTSYASVRESCDRRGNVILAVADHISKVLRLHQGEKKLEEMLPLGPNKALFYKGVASYLLPGQKSPWFIQKPKDVVTLDKQVLSMSSDPESKQEVPMCMDPESRQKLPVGTDPECNLEAAMCANTEVKQEDPVNMGLEAKHQVTVVSDPEILKVARAQHVRAESYLVYSVMSSGEVECSSSLEDATDQALPSQAFVYRPVRQRVYSLLLGGGGGGTPSLRQLWLSQEPGIQAQRLDTLLACFDLSSSREELQAVERPFQALCCLLVYLFVQVDTLCLEDLHAFIAQALCLQGKPAVELADLQLSACKPNGRPRGGHGPGSPFLPTGARVAGRAAWGEVMEELDHIDPRAVQLATLLVRGLTTLVLVNGACGSPWEMADFMPWHLFDGKLFHQKYLQSEKGYTAEVLVEQNRSHVTRFHTLKSVVCKACGKENRPIVSRRHWRPHHAGRWGRQGSSSHGTSSGYSRSGHGQHWRDQGPGSRQYEPDQWRRY